MWRSQKETICVCFKVMLRKYDVKPIRLVLNVPNLMWTGSISRDRNGEKFASICQSTDIVEIK